MSTARQPRPTVALATCAQLPDLDDDEALVIPALAAHGVMGAPAVWDDATVDWGGYDAVVVRSAWDYAERRAEFITWAASLDHVLNRAPVLEWNTDKVYLRELASHGIAVVPTTWLEPGANASDVELPHGEVVVKPAVSAGARNTSRYRAEDAQQARAHIDGLLAQGRTVMVQPYLDSVDGRGETALIYFAGQYSHAVNKGPLLTQPGRITKDLWEAERIRAVQPEADERAVAEDVLDTLAWPRHELLYARVDVVRDAAGRPAVLELELTEPSLFLGHANGAADRLATALVEMITAGR